MRTVDTSCSLLPYFGNKQVAVTRQDTIDMAINLLLPPFTNIDRRQPIMDNYTDIHNYMLGSPYIQGLQQRFLPLLILTTTEASTNTENILANAR